MNVFILLVWIECFYLVGLKRIEIFDFICILNFTYQRSSAPEIVSSNIVPEIVSNTAIDDVFQANGKYEINNWECLDKEIA